MIKGIKYVSLNDNGGYSNAAKGYMQGLLNRGIPITWTPMEYYENQDPNWKPYTGNNTGDLLLDPYYQKQIEYDSLILHISPELYPWWIAHEPNKKLVGYTVWETNTIPSHWVEQINKLDRLMVPCRWNKQVFEDGGVKIPINVIPHLLNQTLSASLNCALPQDNKDYVFYTINTWTKRKAIPQLVEAYLETFSATDPTCLVIKTTSIDDSRTTRPYILNKILCSTRFILNSIKSRYNSPARIRLITKHVRNEEIHKLHQRGDCYVSLCHAEGWGLGAYDAASIGKPIIMTGYGGQLDYLPEDLSYLVNYELAPVHIEEKKHHIQGQKWAEPKLTHASQLMKHVFDHKEEASRKGTLLQKYIHETFPENVVMDDFVRVLNS